MAKKKHIQFDEFFLLLFFGKDNFFQFFSFFWKKIFLIFLFVGWNGSNPIITLINFFVSDSNNIDTDWREK